MSKILYIILFSTFLISKTITGGTISDGLDLAKIDIAKHKDYTRVVFHTNFWEGHSKPNTPADITGGYKFTLSDDNTSIEVELLGYRSSSVKKIDTKDNIKSIKELRGERYADDSSIFYQINLLSKASKIEGFTLDNPSRIVLDIF
jgi:hypothetical protein